MSRVLIVVGAALGVLLAAIVILLSAANPDADIPLQLAQGAINLFVAVAVTGILSFALAQRSAAVSEREDRMRTLTTALQDLKGAYEEASAVRFLLTAHPTALTLTEQMPALIHCRSRLQRLQRERFVLGTEVDTIVQEMLDHLSRVAEEYRVNYPELMHGALLEQAARDSVRTGRSTDRISGMPLDRDTFPHVNGLIADDEWRSGAFHHGYDRAKGLLHSALNRRTTFKRVYP